MVLAEDSLGVHGSAGYGVGHGPLEQVLRSALHVDEVLHVDEILHVLDVGEIGRVIVARRGLVLE